MARVIRNTSQLNAESRARDREYLKSAAAGEGPRGEEEGLANSGVDIS